jgi:cytochrome c-type biogenesis protein CcmH/NrfF
MTTFAHAGHWAVQLLYAVPVLFVVGAIVWSKIQERREEAEETAPDLNADLPSRD